MFFKGSVAITLQKLNTSLLQTDNRGQHSCHQLSIARVSDSEYIGARDSQGAAGFDYLCACQERFVLGWSQQIDLELNAQDFGARGHETVGTIAGSRIRDGGYDSCMQVTMLLR